MQLKRMIIVVCFGIIFICSSPFSPGLAQQTSGPCITCPEFLARPDSAGKGFNLNQGADQSIQLFEETHRHYRMAEEDWKSKRWEHAFARFKYITEKYPSTALAGEAHMKVGLYLKYHGQWDEAINEFQKGIVIIPKTRAAHDAMTSLACIHSSRGNHDEALRLLEEVLAETQDWDQIKYCSYWIKKVRMRKESEKGGRTRACGPKALDIVLRSKGINISEEEFNLLSKNGSQNSVQELKEFIEMKGLKAYGVRVEIEQLDTVQFPVIALVKPDHYIVLLSAGKEGYTLIDPEKGERPFTYSSKEALEGIWTGNILTFGENPDGRTKELSLLTQKEMELLRGGVCEC